MQRAEKLYQKNQLAMQQQYTETLEAKKQTAGRSSGSGRYSWIAHTKSSWMQR